MAGKRACAKEGAGECLRVGVCGLLCERCPKLKRTECSGCAPNPVCHLPACAGDRGVEICFDCPDFPCELAYRFFRKDFLDFLKSDEYVG